MDMIVMFRIFRLTFLPLFLLLGSSCTAGRNSFDTALQLEANGRYDDAMLSCAEAVKADPDKLEYRSHFFDVMEMAARSHAKNGEQLFLSGRYFDSLSEYLIAESLNPGESSYASGAERASKRRDAALAFADATAFEQKNMIKEAAAAYETAFNLDRDNPDYEMAAKRIVKQEKSGAEVASIDLKSETPMTLRFRETSLRDVFRVITRLSGISFVFDEGFKEQNVTIDLENITFSKALDLLTAMYGLGRKNLNATTIKIYPQTVEKRDQRAEMILFTYRLRYIDAQKAINLVSSMVTVNSIIANDKLNTIIFRDTPETVDLVNKILEANDLPIPELLMDVEMLSLDYNEAKKMRLLLNSYHPGLLVKQTGEKIYSRPDAPSGLGQLVDFISTRGTGGYVAVPNVTYKLVKKLSKAELFANARLSVKNMEKTEFTAGQIIPPDKISPNGEGVKDPKQQYLDLGIRMSAVPAIKLNNRIDLQLNLEVNSAVKQEKANDDATLLATATRRLDAVLSLKDGETAIIGGLIQDAPTDNRRKHYLPGAFPLRTPLGSELVEIANKNELILAITPRLVRGLTLPPSSLFSFYGYRDEHTPSTSKKTAKGNDAVQPVQQIHNSFHASRTIMTQQVTDEQKSSRSAGQISNASQSLTGTEALLSVDSASVPETRNSLTGLATIGFMGPSYVKNGDTILMPVHISNADSVASATFAVIFDPEYFELLSVKEGSFFSSESDKTSFSHSSGAGAVTVNVGRPASELGSSGNGVVAVLAFKAKRAGTSTGFGIANITLNQTAARRQQALALGSSVEIR